MIESLVSFPWASPQTFAAAWSSTREAAGVTGWLAAASLAVFTLMSAIGLFNLVTAPRAARLPRPRRRPRVSLLVPARNEAHNIPILAAHLAALDYPDLEIILLDDASEDDTWRALDDLVQRVHRPEHGVTARAVRGAPLAAGWLGKNWACHQLAQAATGEILVFCDADARPGPRAVERTVALLERYGAGAATLMPRQELGTWAERAVIPVLLHLSLIGFVPLALVPYLPWRSLGIGNGQWLCFTRRAYAAVGGHVSVHDRVVEDLALARRAQEFRQKLAIALAPDTLTVRMYRNFGEVWDGFGKNLFVLTGGGLVTAPFWFTLFALIHIAPWALWWSHPLLWTPSLALLVFWRVVVALMLREPLRGVLLQPMGALLVPLIAARSIFAYRSRRLMWKGRVLPTGPAATEKNNIPNSPSAPSSRDIVQETP